MENGAAGSSFLFSSCCWSMSRGLRLSLSVCWPALHKHSATSALRVDNGMYRVGLALRHSNQASTSDKSSTWKKSSTTSFIEYVFETDEVSNPACLHRPWSNCTQKLLFEREYFVSFFRIGKVFYLRQQAGCRRTMIKISLFFLSNPGGKTNAVDDLKLFSGSSTSLFLSSSLAKGIL